MKKYLWLIAILAALLLVFSGCGGNPGDDDDDDEETRGVPIDGTEAWWVAPSQRGRDRKYPDNIVPVFGENDDASYVHIFWIPHGIIPQPSALNFFVDITFVYESEFSFGIDMMWQCGFDPYGTWARSSGDDDYVDNVAPYHERTFSAQPGRDFPGSNWDETKKVLYPDKTKLTISEMTGLCIQIPMDYEFDAGFIRVIDVKFRAGVHPNPPGGVAITGPYPPAK